jgi:Spy/CpxP family protein refolding chaperone
MVDKLKLTDDQRKAMDDTLQQHRESLVDMRGALEKAELELEPMMKQDQPNESQVLAQIDKVAQARAELEKANARFLLAIRNKLTPDQRKTMEADWANHPHGNWKGAGSGSRWQGRQSGQTPDGQAPSPPPPGGPQSMLDGGPAPQGPPAPEEVAFDFE